MRILGLEGVLLAYNSGNDCYGPLTDNGANLAGDASCGFAGGLNNVDPLLQLLDDNGGETQTHALLDGSPALNQIPYGTNGCGATVTTDQRGFPRPYDSACDVGAFESQGFTLSLTGGNNQSAAVNTAFAAPLVVTLTTSETNLSVVGRVITFTGPSVGAGISSTVVTATTNSSGVTSVTVTANDTAGSYVVTATATGVGSDVTFVLTNTAADLAISKVVNPATAAPGETITYTLAFSNAGDVTATGVVITDFVPVSVTVVSGQWVVDSGQITPTSGITYEWTVSDLVPGDGGVITITAVVTQPLVAGVFTNTATITSSTAETVTTNNTAEIGLIIDNVAPVLTAIGNQTITETETLTFTASASDNNGDSLTYGLSNPPANATINSSTGIFTWTPSQDQGPDSYSIYIIVTDTGGLTDTTQVMVTVKDTPPSLSITKTVELSGSSPAIPGDPLTYTIVISNSGGGAENVTVTDTLPSGLSGDTLNWSGTLTANTTKVFTLNATILNIAANYTATITNTAYLYHTSGNLSDTVSFNTISDTVAPPDPTLITPADTSIITNTDNLTFSWSAVTDALSGLDYYTLQVDSENDGLSIQASSDSITTTQTVYTPTTLANGVYTWTVRAHDLVGNVSNGLTATFTISATSSGTTVYLPIVVKNN